MPEEEKAGLKLLRIKITERMRFEKPALYSRSSDTNTSSRVGPSKASSRHPRRYRRSSSGVSGELIKHRTTKLTRRARLAMLLGPA